MKSMTAIATVSRGMIAAAGNGDAVRAAAEDAPLRGRHEIALLSRFASGKASSGVPRLASTWIPRASTHASNSSSTTHRAAGTLSTRK